MSGDFEQNLSLSQWHEGLDAVEKGAEPFTRIVKKQRGTMVKTLMAGKQSHGEKSCDVGSLADIHTDVERFLSQERHWSWRGY